MKGLAIVTAAALLAACGGGDATSGAGRHGLNDAPGSNEPHGEPMPHQQCVGSGGSVASQDVNGDGQPDIWTLTRDGHVYCRESDANFDTRVDVYRWFDAAGLPTRVEDDYDFDGRVDSVGTYANGVIQSDVLDTNFDGITDTWRTYVNGHVRELRRDANGDGMVDTWERYDDAGRVIWSGEDTNHDGRPDSEPDAGTATPSTLVQVIPSGGAAVAPPTPTPPATPPPAAQPPATPTDATPTATPSAQKHKTTRHHG